MNSRDWALVAFTLLNQMAVGAFVVLGIVHAYIARRAGKEEADRMSDRALLAIGPVLAVGIIASLFHLGSPFSAYRAVLHLSSSWLSREILFTLLFALVGLIFAVMQWRKYGSPRVRNTIAVVAAVLGLVLVYTMARVYMQPTVPVWNTWYTPLYFFVTAFLLGTLAMAAALAGHYFLVLRKDKACADLQCSLLQDVTRSLVIAAIVLLGVQVVAAPVYLSYLASVSSSAAASTYIAQNDLAYVAVQLALLFIGAGILGLFIFRHALETGRTTIMANLTYAAFAVVLVGEVVGRYVFYASYLRIGM
jgi:anaerobic dimethyl sulfoxide reductase subunit C (anchor subunit)